MSANPLAGLSSTMGDLAKVMRGRPLVTPPKTYTPNRQQRRARGRGAQQAAGKHRTQRELQAATRLGQQAGRRGEDHTVAGTCPYTDKQLVDAWAEGYVAGKRKREETRPCP